ncbi:MAG: rod shape-determining protein MreD [Pseudomonadota bacterium]
MERYAPSARSDRYGSRINREQSPWRAASVPYATIAIASLLPFFALSGEMPIVPPLGFLLFLTWRVMRPGLLPLWVGVPLGAFDDLFSGQPFGSAILLWSLTMIILELIESRFPWRGFWQDWFTASLGIIFYIVAAMVVSGSSLTIPMTLVLLPQIVLSILLYPILAQLVARFDRFRLSRSRRVH